MFGKRIAELRKNMGLTQAELAKSIGISRSALSLYETEKREPDIDTISKFSVYFGKAADYLLGISESEFDGNFERKYPSLEHKSGKILLGSELALWNDCLKRIRSLLDERHTSEEKFCRELGIDLNGEIVISDFLRIADRLGVSTDYLLGVSEIRHVAESDLQFANSLSAREKNIIETFRDLNPDNQDIMIGELKKCLKEQRRESAPEEPLKQAK